MRPRPIPQYSDSKLGIAISKQGELIDPTTPPVITVTRLDTNAEIVGPDAATVHDGTGLYSYHMTYDDTTTAPLKVSALWEYTLDGPRTFTETWEIYGPMPTWYGLSDQEKEMVDGVYDRVANTFDSTQGGPYLWEVLQASFNPWEVIANAAGWAVDWINYFGQPTLAYGFGDGTTAPFPEAGSGLLEKATVYQFYRHLSRSYIEIPDSPGVTVAKLDRRRYRQDWLEEARLELADLTPMIKQFKRAAMFRSRALLVSGGAFPRQLFIPTRPMWMYFPLRY